MSLPRKPRQDRPLAEQHEEWIAHLRRHAVSRRTMVRGAVIALDVTPAPTGTKTTMVLRFINEQGRELDRVVFSRIAGA